MTSKNKTLVFLDECLPKMPDAWKVGDELFPCYAAIPFRLLPPVSNPMPLYSLVGLESVAWLHEWDNVNHGEANRVPSVYDPELYYRRPDRSRRLYAWSLAGISEEHRRQEPDSGE